MGRRRLKVRRFCFVCALGTFNLIRLTTIDASIHAHTHSHTHTWQWAEGPYKVPGGTLAIAWGSHKCRKSQEAIWVIVWILTRRHFLTPTRTDTCKRTQTYASCAIEEFEWTGKKMLFSQQSHRSTIIRLIRASACSTTDSQRITLITPLLYRTVNTWQLPGEKLSLHCKFFRKCIKILFHLHFICIG